VDVQIVGLWAVGLPEDPRVWGAQSGNAAAGLARRDGPGREGGYFAETGRCWGRDAGLQRFVRI
jgi:hypothetical protein